MRAAPGIDAAIDHLVEQGHRRIALLGHSNPHPAIRNRLAAFNAATARHRLAVPDDYIQLRDSSAVAHGDDATRQLLALPARPTAIVAATEGLALGALRALYEAQVRVPADMSLVSYDDAFAVHLYPPLTSVAQPFQELAERAVALILEQLGRPDDATAVPTQIALPTRLVIRESTRPPVDRAVAAGDRGSTEG